MEQVKGIAYRSAHDVHKVVVDQRRNDSGRVCDGL